MQHYGGGAVVRLRDNLPEPVALVIVIGPVADNEPNCASFEYVAARRDGSSPVRHFSLDVKLPARMIDDLWIPNRPLRTAHKMWLCLVIVALCLVCEALVEAVDAFGGGKTQVKLEHAVAHIVIARGQVEFESPRLCAQHIDDGPESAAIRPLEVRIANIFPMSFGMLFDPYSPRLDCGENRLHSLDMVNMVTT